VGPDVDNASRDLEGQLGEPIVARGIQVGCEIAVAAIERAARRTARVMAHDLVASSEAVARGAASVIASAIFLEAEMNASAGHPREGRAAWWSPSSSFPGR